MGASVELGKPEYYLFIIDTDTYAGNFEREICAYMTGQTGDCGVGEKEAEIAEKEIPQAVSQLEEIIESVADEHGGYRPALIFPNPKYGNDGHGNQEVLTDENRAKFKFIADNSIAIYFHTIPDNNLLNILKERAQSFASKKGIKVEGFRFLEQHKIYNELKIV